MQHKGTEMQHKVKYSGRDGYDEAVDNPFEVVSVVINAEGFRVAVGIEVVKLMKAEDIEAVAFAVRDALYRERPELRRQ